MVKTITKHHLIIFKLSAPKGNKFSKGKPLGAKNKKTLEWEEFGKQLLDVGLPRVIEIMQTCDDDKLIENFSKLLSYFKPQLARAEVTGKDGKDLPQPIINVFENNSNSKDNKSN